jgi:hypothetical protein
MLTASGLALLPRDRRGTAGRKPTYPTRSAGFEAARGRPSPCCRRSWSRRADLLLRFQMLSHTGSTTNGDDVKLSDTEPRLVCSICGRKGADVKKPIRPGSLIALLVFPPCNQSHSPRQKPIRARKSVKPILAVKVERLESPT